MKQVQRATLITLLALATLPSFAGDYINGDSYTMWAVIFNAPENCSGGVCNMEDVINPGPAETALFYMGGTRVPPNGAFVLGGAVPENSSYGSEPFPTTMLYDSQTAEVHLVLRSHGKYLPGVADTQVTTALGGCVTQDCEDVQFAVFLPGEADANGEQRATVARFADGTTVPLAWATLYRDADGIRAAFHTNIKSTGDICGQ